MKKSSCWSKPSRFHEIFGERSEPQAIAIVAGKVERWGSSLTPTYELSNDAGRNAYFAAFHATQALIFERTGKIAKTPQGVQGEFYRLAKDEPSIDKNFPAFLSQAYNLKAVADYETGPDAVVAPERAAAAIATAGRFIDCITKLIQMPNQVPPDGP